MPHETDRLTQFQTLLGQTADLAFLPTLSADLQYLTGIPRDLPTYGHTIHPGDWLEGGWITPRHRPILPLPRMTAEFGGLSQLETVEVRLLGEWDDPETMVRDILRGFKLPAKPTIAISDMTRGETVAHLHAILPDATFVSATEILRPLRLIKSEAEIAQMRIAGQMTEAAFGDTLKQLRIGMTELELVAEINYQLRKHGSLGESFTTSLYNSGPNHPLRFGQRLATWPRLLTPPVTILFDFGAIYNGWCYDYGRTVFFGSPPPAVRRIYELVMASQAAGIAALKAGAATTTDADAAARQVIIDGGYWPEFRHRLGHGIGMDVHEPPFLTKGDETPLQEGMLFTIEPSITQLHDFSARVEDVVVARPGGGEKLTSGWQELIVVE